jgi:hypothetical protein
VIPTRTPDQLAAELAAPFPETELRWKPKSVSGARCLALPYVTAACVIARLTHVLGLAGWQDRYQVLASGAVLCTLRCRIGEEWISHQDVGVPSNVEAAKGACSDSLKRAARKFGVGAYLCRLGGQWLAYDARTKQITGKPQFPTWALPNAELSGAHRSVPNGQPAKPANLPASGEELEQRLAAYDGKLASEGVIMDGDLLCHVSGRVAEAGHGLDVRQWGQEAILLAVQAAKAFEGKARTKETRKQATVKRIAGKIPS